MAIRSQREIPPGGRIRVLIVDDSVVVRKVASSLIDKAMGMEVAGTAANGRIALRRMSQYQPDVVTLDLEMPEMGGLETLKAIRRDYPQVRIIMFSSSTRRGAAETLEALALGADDYATKADDRPSDGPGGSFCADLIPKIRQFFKSGDDAPRAATAAAPRPVPPPAPRRAAGDNLLDYKAVVVGVSTGGPAALSELLPKIPDKFPVPILIVQHMPPTFTARLAERLQGLTRLHVMEATAGHVVAPGEVIIAPGDYHMRVVKGKSKTEIALDQGPPENSCRPAADVLFRSAAEVWGGEVIAAMLTGMGQDGLKGVELLRSAGAYVVAQDEASSVVWGMPGALVNAGLADIVVPLTSIPNELQRLLRKQ